MNQKGFIQIPLLVAIIIATISVASAGAGVVLYNQGKLASFIANISETLKEPEKTVVTEESQKEELLVTTQEGISQQELEKDKLESEQTKLEAERTIFEIEKLKQEIAALKESKEQEETAIPYINEVIPSQILNNITNVLTIKGEKFQKGTIVLIGNNSPKEVNIVDDKTITAKISPGLTATSYDIKIINPDGKTSTLNNGLTVINVPVAPIQPEFTTEEISAMVSPTVVHIFNDKDTGCPCSGSGVLIDNNGYILTNEHVIKNDSVVDVVLMDGRRLNGEVIGWNEEIDLALIKINAINLNHVIFNNSYPVKQGEKVVVFGHPLGLPNVFVSEGIVTATPETGGKFLIWTDAKTQPGSSGGPWINKKAELIGIHLGGIGPKLYGVKVDIGYNYAIPISIVNSILSDLKSGVKISIASPASEPEPEPEPEPQPQPAPATVSVVKNSSVGDVEIFYNASSIIGSYLLTAGASQGITINKIILGTSASTDISSPSTYNIDAAFSNIRLYYGNVQLGQTIIPNLISPATTYEFNGLNLSLSAGQTVRLDFKADVLYEPLWNNTDRTKITRVEGLGKVTANSIIFDNQVAGQGINLYRGSLTAAINCHSSCTGRTRSAFDKIANLTFSNNGLVNARVESITIHISGNVTSTANGIAFYLKTTGGTEKAVGYFDYANMKAILIPSTEISIGSSGITLEIITDTTKILEVPASGISRVLSLSINLGAYNTAGDVIWYDQTAAATSSISWLSGPSPISVTLSLATGN